MSTYTPRPSLCWLLLWVCMTIQFPEFSHVIFGGFFVIWNLWVAAFFSTSQERRRRLQRPQKKPAKGPSYLFTLRHSTELELVGSGAFADSSWLFPVPFDEFFETFVFSAMPESESFSSCDQCYQMVWQGMCRILLINAHFSNQTWSVNTYLIPFSA